MNDKWSYGLFNVDYKHECTLWKVDSLKSVQEIKKKMGSVVSSGVFICTKKAWLWRGVLQFVVQNAVSFRLLSLSRLKLWWSTAHLAMSKQRCRASIISDLANSITRASLSMGIGQGNILNESGTLKEVYTMTKKIYMDSFMWHSHLQFP